MESVSALAPDQRRPLRNASVIGTAKEVATGVNPPMSSPGVEAVEGCSAEAPWKGFVWEVFLLSFSIEFGANWPS